MKKPTLPNPSGLVLLQNYFDRGLLTEAELQRLRLKALNTNAYTGKTKTNAKNRS